MSANSIYKPQNPFMQWLERRLPIASLVYSSFIVYPTPRNLNYWWTFGGILTFMLAAQIVTGIVLAMHYTPHVDFAFTSVKLIMRDVNSAGCCATALQRRLVLFRRRLCPHRSRHVLRLLQGSARSAVDPRRHPVPADGGHRLHGLRAALGPDELLGRDRHHQSVFRDPRVGDPIVTWLWGGYAVGNPTLNRFYSLHYLLPFVIAGVVVLHIWALHMVGQNNPTGVEPKAEKDTVAFTPYATIKDAFFIGVFCLFLAWFMFYIPNYLGHSDNYIPANPGQTPTHIVPEWDYLPFYAILRAIPSKLLGVIALLASSCYLPFCPGLIRRGCARRNIGRFIGNS